MKKLIRITTVPLSLDKLLEGQLGFMKDTHDVIAVSSDKEYLKELIWIFSSSQNHRIYVEKKDKKQIQDWDKIEKVVIRIQKACIYY